MIKIVPYACMLLALAGVSVTALSQPGEPPLRIVGVTGLSYGAWVTPGTKMEEWLPMARAICQADDYCQIHVFEGEELATHEDPVPEANRKALKWVFRQDKGAKPAILVEEVHPEPGKEPKRFTFDLEGGGL